MLRILLLVTLSSVVVLAQENACVAPSYFEATFMQYDHLTNFYRRAKIFYDAKNERVRLIEDTSEGQSHLTLDMLLLYKEGKNFTIERETKKCHLSQTEGEFHRIKVEEGDKFAQNMIIGTVPGDGVEIGIWIREVNTNNVVGTHITEFTSLTCIPFYHSFDGVVNGRKLHYYRVFYNVVTQVTDPDIFMVPEECL